MTETEKDRYDKDLEEMSQAIEALTNDKGEFTCDSCGKTFIEHVILMTNPPRVHCPYCRNPKIISLDPFAGMEGLKWLDQLEN